MPDVENVINGLEREIARTDLEWLDCVEVGLLRDALAFCIMRLASRVDELRKAGHPIITERVEGRNRYGEKCHWARYRMGARV